MSILDAARLKKCTESMFDLSFFKIVKTTFEWTEAPASHYANEHERYMMKNKRIPHATECGEKTLLMSPETRLLHWYIHTTYPPYFGLELNIGKAYIQEYHRAC